MGEAKYIYFTCLKYFRVNLYLDLDLSPCSNDQQKKGHKTQYKPCLRTSISSCTGSGMATAWTITRRSGRRKLVKATNAPLKRRSFVASRPRSTTKNATPRRCR